MKKNQKRDIVRKIDYTTQISLTREDNNVFMFHYETYTQFRYRLIPSFIYKVLNKYDLFQKNKLFFKWDWACFGHRPVVYDHQKERFFFPVQGLSIFQAIFNRDGDKAPKMPEPKEAGVSLVEVMDKLSTEYKISYENAKSTIEAFDEMMEEARTENPNF